MKMSRLSPILAVVLGIGGAIAVNAGLPERYVGCKKPWIFFDLGNTVISSGVDGPSAYLPGAHAYVRELREHGYPVGLITNVPEKWGTTRTAKIRELKKLVAETWTKDAGAEAMDWSDFPENRIIIPPRDADRKPAPYLFHSALARVSREEGAENCPVVFQGDDPLEVEAAERNGMTGYLVRKDAVEPFLPLDRLERL